MRTAGKRAVSPGEAVAVSYFRTLVQAVVTTVLEPSRSMTDNASMSQPYQRSSGRLLNRCRRPRRAAMMTRRRSG